jgi:ApaG protein
MAKYEFTVTVSPRFLSEQSDPDNERYFFAYTIRIVNSGEVRAQLISRHWIITDANQHTEHVRGPGVVGEQPHLGPGDAFEYTSGCPLTTPFGSMQGSYQCVADDGTAFDVPIAEFLLTVPRTLH